jgi:hypothetical protein
MPWIDTTIIEQKLEFINEALLMLHDDRGCLKLNKV